MDHKPEAWNPTCQVKPRRIMSDSDDDWAVPDEGTFARLTSQT